jgi:predicted methyltransferase
MNKDVKHRLPFKFWATIKAFMLVSMVFATFSASAIDLEQVVKGAHRSDAAKARDVYRHPIETLKFFDVEPTMTVVEVSPGGGWYTEILAPYLKDKGRFIAAHFDPESEVEYYRNSLKKYQEKVAQASIYGKVEFSVFAPPAKVMIAPEGTVDRVLTFRNVHNWYISGGEDAVKAAFDGFYKALKPGGILGVVEHRLPESMDQEQNKRSGYVKQSLVIQWAEQAGFKLLGASEINANAKDTADHPKGVWTLPPSLRLGEQDRDKYLAIGESDRMTLKFVKLAEE